MFDQKVLLSVLILSVATAAVFAPAFVLGLCGVALIIASIWRWPFFGIATAILVTLGGEFARIQIGGLSLLPLDLLAPAVLGIWALKKVVQKENWQLDAIGGWLIAFWGVAALSLAWNMPELSIGELQEAALHLIRFVSISGLIFVVRDAVHAECERENVLKVLLLASALLALSGFVLMRLLPDFAEAGLAGLGWDPHIGRLTASWLDPNFAGGAFAFFLAFAGARFLHTKKAFEQAVLIGLAGILLVALLLTFSRSGLLAFGVAGLILGALRSRSLLIAGIVLGILGTSLSPRLQERLGELAQSAASLGDTSQQVLDPTAQLRVDSWHEGWRIFTENPVIGVGYGAYASAQTFSDSESHAATGSDSSILNVAATTGAVGLLAFLGLLFSIFQKAWQQRMSWAGLGLLAGGSGLLVHAVFVNSLFFAPLLLYFFVGVGVLRR